MPIGTAADSAAVFYGVALTRLELRISEEHDHAVAASWTATTSTSELWALVGTDDRAVRLKDLDGVAGLRVDFHGGLGADVGRRVARCAARADVSAARTHELVPVAVEAFLGLARAIGDGETAVEG